MEGRRGGFESDERDGVPDLVGRPSDGVPEILREGGAGVGMIWMSFSARQPEGRDAEYIEWHTLDHRSEQHRLPPLRASIRVVSTPQCRAARAASDPRYDSVDHVMTYFFAGVSAMEGFVGLSVALREAGRVPYLLPIQEMGAYGLDGKMAAPRVRIGADVLPWRPYRGVYVLVEEGKAPPPPDLAEVPGVAGVWWGGGIAVEGATAENSGLQLTYCFLDGHPAEVAELLTPLLQRRWADPSVVPLLAAPFHVIVPFEWARYLP